MQKDFSKYSFYFTSLCGSPGTRVTGGSELLCGCWEANVDLLQEW